MTNDFPFPESLCALALQVQLLRAGRKPAMLVPYGLPPSAVPADMHAIATTAGQLIATSPEALRDAKAAMEADRLGEALGYGIPRKPDKADRALTLCDDLDREILTVMADAETEPVVTQSLERMAGPGHWIRRGEPAEVLRERAAWWVHFFNNLVTTNHAQQ